MTWLTWCRINPHGPGLHAPKRDGDIGWDLEAADPIDLRPNQQYDMPCNVRVKLPEGVWAEMRARSSIAKRGLAVDAGILDNGYTGPIFVVLRNVTTRTVPVREGDRVAQLILHQMVPAESLEVADFEDDPRRGALGFGSTGA